MEVEEGGRMEDGGCWVLGGGVGMEEWRLEDGGWMIEECSMKDGEWRSVGWRVRDIYYLQKSFKSSTLVIVKNPEKAVQDGPLKLKCSPLMSLTTF